MLYPNRTGRYCEVRDAAGQRLGVIGPKGAVAGPEGLKLVELDGPPPDPRKVAEVERLISQRNAIEARLESAELQPAVLALAAKTAALETAPQAAKAAEK